MLAIFCEILELFNKQFTIHLNHKGLLNVIIKHAGVIDEKFRSVCSVLDQLDKLSPEEIEKKLIN